jgi:hypothetical protein
LLASSLVISLYNPLFPFTRSANANANTEGVRYLLLSVIVASDVQDEKMIGEVKRVFSPGPSSRGSGSCSSDGSQDFAWSLSFVPSPHETRGSIHYLAHNDVPMATNGNAISIHSTKEMEKYESLCHREFGHTRVYNVNLLERVGMDEELPLILRTIGWRKLYEGDWMTRVMDG